MPSPKAFLRDVADFKLDPKVAHTKTGADGRVHGKEAVKPKAEAPVKSAKAETADANMKAPAEEPKKLPPTPDHSGRSKQKKAINAHDSVESNVHTDKEATKEPEPATVPEPAVDSDDNV